MTPQPKMELARTLWTMTKSVEAHPLSPDRSITAAIYVTAAGRELRVHYGENRDNPAG